MCAEEPNLKLLNIYFLLLCHFYSTKRFKLKLFENLENVEPNFLSLSTKIKFLFYCMILKPIIPKVSIKKFLKMQYPNLNNLKQVLVFKDH